MSDIAIPQSPRSLEEINALQRMKKGVLLVFIAWIFLGISILVGITSILAMGAMDGLEGLVAGDVALVVLIIVGVIIALIGLYREFIPGVKNLADIYPEFSTAAKLIRIGYIGGLILLLIGAILTLVLIGLLIIVIGLILVFLGTIGVIILCFKLKDKYQDTLYLVAGVLFIIGLFIPILAVIAWILLYAGLGSTVRKLQSTTPSPATQPV